MTHPNRPNLHPLRYPYAPRSCWHYAVEIAAGIVILFACSALLYLLWYGASKGL